MTDDELDAWAKGLLFGVCRVLDPHYRKPRRCRRETYPEIAAPFVRLALRWIRRRRLDVPAPSLAYARAWLERVDPPRRSSTQRRIHEFQQRKR